MTKNATDKQPRLNLRYVVFCALGLAFGIFLLFRIRFGGLRPSDFCFLLAFLAAAVLPLSLRRTGAVLAAVALSAGVGMGIAALSVHRYLRGPGEGSYLVVGTVCSVTEGNGYSSVLLTHLFFDGERAGGKLQMNVYREDVRMGDILTVEADVTRNGLPMSEDPYAEYNFYSDIRYTAPTSECAVTGRSANIFYRLQAALRSTLLGHMRGESGKIAFALLTGNSHGMDRGLLREVRSGGIAHIFAVSGLHIGILFTAVTLLFSRLRRKAYFPAVAMAFFYTAFCSFSVSSVRALIMCAVLGGYRVIGRKYDFLQSIAFAAIVLLLICPADFLSTGFRLSFGACLGLALFAGTLSRLFGRIPHLPRFLRGYFAAGLSVHFLTVPVLLEAFGYFSVWGFLLNLVFIPALPVIFLTVLLCSVLALIIPPAAAVLLLPANALLSLFLLLFSVGDFGFVLRGFSLGMGTVVWMFAAMLLSECFRMKAVWRAVVGGVLAVALTCALLFENVVFAGGRVTVYAQDGNAAALFRTRSAAVLVIDGTIETQMCRDMLAHCYGGTLDGVIVLSEDETAAINHAAFLPARAVYARDEVPTGLRETKVVFGEEVTLGGLCFRFEGREKLSVSGEGVVIEVDFHHPAALGADLFIDWSSGGLKFSFGHGIIKRI